MIKSDITFKSQKVKIDSRNTASTVPVVFIPVRVYLCCRYDRQIPLKAMISIVLFIKTCNTADDTKILALFVEM